MSFYNSSSTGNDTSLASNTTGTGFQVQRSEGYFAINDYISFEGSNTHSVKIGGKGIHPELYFKYVKSKFGVLERMRLERRIKRIETAFDKAAEAGQYLLAEKFLGDIAREVRESLLYAKGIRHFIEYDDIQKHKKNIRGGHISDTKLENYTLVIPKDVLAKKDKVKNVFDGFVIYHYWDQAAADKIAKKQKMSNEEKNKMRDPVLFGFIKESNRLYFVADWIDEYCDLTFDEIIDVVGKPDEELTLTSKPNL